MGQEVRKERLTVCRKRQAHTPATYSSAPTTATGRRKSCADGGGNAALKDYLKEQVEKRGWKGRVRVSSGGCMGLCGKGPNVMIYPQKAWFAVASPADGDRILGEIETLLAAPPEK